MSSKTLGRVALLCGGPSPEAEISRRSAAGVAAAATEAGFLVETLELDADWLSRLQAGSFDLVMPLFHGVPGEDGSVQGVLELLNLPSSGATWLQVQQPLTNKPPKYLRKRRVSQ